MSDNISKEVEQAIKKAMNSIESCFKNEVKKESEETLYDYTSSIKDMYDGGWEDRYQLGISGAFEDRESIDSTIIREGNNIFNSIIKKQKIYTITHKEVDYIISISDEQINISQRKK